jgi:hypothetical protein
MDAILEDEKLSQHVAVIESMIGILSEPDNEDEGSIFDDDYKLTIWVKEKNIIRASGDISTLKKLDPGVYTIDFSRELGLYSQTLKSTSDELFMFSDSVTENLVQEIDLFWDKKDLYKADKLVHKRGILLEGFPGTGKSSIITQLSDRIIAKGGVVFKVSGFRNLDHYVSFLRTGFRKIQPDTPIITILEDIDQYGDVESSLLDFLDGKTHIDHHIVIATSNNTEDIPDTFLRPSRLDLRIEIPLPSEQTRREYFQFKNIPDTMVEELVTETDGASLADLKELYICIFLLDYTLEDALMKINSPRNKKNYLYTPKNKTKIGL